MIIDQSIEKRKEFEIYEYYFINQLNDHLYRY